MHSPLELPAVLPRTTISPFSRLNYALRERSAARYAERKQAEALSGLDAHTLDDIGLSDPGRLNCKACLSIYNPYTLALATLFYRNSTDRHSKR
jgi:uncharacterized protein YjiS (DUF1127 family)